MICANCSKLVNLTANKICKKCKGPIFDKLSIICSSCSSIDKICSICLKMIVPNKKSDGCGCGK